MRERIQRNIRGRFVGEAGSRIISFAFNLALARGLGTEAYGRYNYAYAFAGLTMLCGELGLNTLLTREVAADKANAASLLRRFAPLRLLSIVLVGIGTVCLGLAFADTRRLPEIALMSVFMVGNALLDYHSAVLSAFERMSHDAALRIGTRVAVAGFGLASVLLFHAPLWAVLSATAAGNLVAAAAGWGVRRQMGLAPGFEWDGRFVVQTLRASVPMAAAITAGVLYFYMDSLVLAALGFGDDAIGQYGAASKILEASHSLPMVVAGGVFPIVAELSRAHGPGAAAPFFSRISRLCLAWAVPAAGVCAIAAPFVARFLYGSRYVHAGPALSVLALAAPLYYSNLIAGYLFIAQGRPGFTALFRFGACLVKVGALIALSRWLGALSPAAAMVIADGTLFGFLLAYRAARGLAERPEGLLAARVVVAFGGAVVAWLLTRGLGIVPQAVATAGAYAGITGMALVAAGTGAKSGPKQGVAD